jgi:hypothetical protein
MMRQYRLKVWTIAHTMALNIVPLDPRNLPPVANISGMIDDSKLLAFIAFRGRVAGKRRLRDYRKREHNNIIIATIGIIGFAHYKYGDEITKKNGIKQKLHSRVARLDLPPRTA